MLKNRALKKIAVLFCLLTFAGRGAGFCEMDMERGEVLYQIDIYMQLSEYLNDLFQEFSEGYIEADPALKKVTVAKYEYHKITGDVPEEVRTLNRLVKELLSQIENYFIYFKRTDRENPLIDLRILELRHKLLREAERLRVTYM